jgi:hypothetical protein
MLSLVRAAKAGTGCSIWRNHRVPVCAYIISLIVGLPRRHEAKEPFILYPNALLLSDRKGMRLLSPRFTHAQGRARIHSSRFRADSDIPRGAPFRDTALSFPESARINPRPTKLGSEGLERPCLVLGEWDLRGNAILRKSPTGRAKPHEIAGSFLASLGHMQNLGSGHHEQTNPICAPRQPGAESSLVCLT